MCIANLSVSLNLIKILLAPFSALYGMVITLRNYLYDRQVFKSVHFSPFIICVGNLRVGGTGKSPMIEYLGRLLKDEYSVAILSRGYGRNTKGIRLANEEDTAQTLGDEPFQFYQKFGKNQKVVIAVGEERILAVPEILYLQPETEIILLDDAFQHRAIVADLNILLTEYARPFYSDTLLPGGRLRETRKGATRADVVIVSKCPAEIAEAQMLSMEKNIRKIYCSKYTCFFYGNPLSKPFGYMARTTGNFTKSNTGKWHCQLPTTRTICTKTFYFGLAFEIHRPSSVLDERLVAPAKDVSKPE
jgi:tetraacyldisaccharide 4'-kinase